MTTTLVRGRTALLLLVCLTLLASQPAGAQQRTPTPSGAELRETYPLRPSPTPSPQRSASPSGTVSGSARQQPADRASDSGRAAPLALLGLLALAAASGALWRSRLRRRRPHPAEAGAPPSQDHRTNGRAREPAPEVSVATPFMPPDRHRSWTATIEWRERGAASHFSVVARAAGSSTETVLADSGPVDWPPTSRASVQALGAAAARLEDSLAAAGWKPLPSGREWYAKRFSWEPAAGEPSGSPAARQPGATPLARRAG